MIEDNIPSFQKINSAIDEGFSMAGKLIESEKNEKLQGIFLRTFRMADRFLDNFDAKKFEERKNNDKPLEGMKLMLLGAFESVSCLVHLNKNGCLGRDEDVRVQYDRLVPAFQVYSTQVCGMNVKEREVIEYTRLALEKINFSEARLTA